MFSPRLRISTILCFLSLFNLLGSVDGQTSTAQSNIFTLDTRSGVLIRGVVLDGTAAYGPYAPLAGATATVGSSSTTSNSRGVFEIMVTLTSAQNATISKQTFANWTQSLGTQASGTELDLGAIILRPSGKPVIQSSDHRRWNRA